jgi:hypothetical protein
VEAKFEGDISMAIQKVADDEKISLYCNERLAKGVIGGILLGNVAKIADRSILVIRPGKKARLYVPRNSNYFANV